MTLELGLAIVGAAFILRTLVWLYRELRSLGAPGFVGMRGTVGLGFTVGHGFRKSTWWQTVLSMLMLPFGCIGIAGCLLFMACRRTDNHG